MLNENKVRPRAKWTGDACGAGRLFPWRYLADCSMEWSLDELHTLCAVFAQRNHRVKLKFASNVINSSSSSGVNIRAIEELMFKPI